MVTTTAMAVMVYSGTLALVGAILSLVAGTRPRLRSAGLRLIAIFGVFALASLYVWLELGPEVDARRAASDRPMLPPAPHAIDV